MFETVESHKLMLKDKIRTLAYKKAIDQTVKKGQNVLDFGCGTGIMSFFAARAGAKNVYGVDRSRFVRIAKKIAEKNQFSNISFFHDDENTLSLPEKVGLIIWEGMGSFVVNEWAVNSLIVARDRFLLEGGELIPSYITILGSLVCDERRHEETSYFMKKPFNVDFSPIEEWPFHKVINTTIEPSSLIGPKIEFEQLDLLTLTNSPLRLEGHVTLDRAEAIHGICGWFEARLTKDVKINTGPNAPKTHWKQIYFPFKEPFLIKPRKEIEITIEPIQMKNKKGTLWVWSISDGIKVQRMDSFVHNAWLTRDLPKGQLC